MVLKAIRGSRVEAEQKGIKSKPVFWEDKEEKMGEEREYKYGFFPSELQAPNHRFRTSGDYVEKSIHGIVDAGEDGVVVVVEHEFDWEMASPPCHCPREQVLQAWFKRRIFTPIRSTLLYFKMVILYNIFTQVDKHREYPLWEAIGYTIDKVENVPKPFQNGIIETFYVKDSTQLALHQQIKAFMYQKIPGKMSSRSNATLWKSTLDAEVVSRLRCLPVREGPSLENLYESGGSHPSVDGKILILAGSKVGGGCAVIWSACIRTPATLRRDWAEECKLQIFASKEYVSTMDIVWKRLGVMEGCKMESLRNQVLRKGCRNLGLDVENVPRNSFDGHYCGSFRYGCRRGDKKGSERTCLVDDIKNGSVILTACKAERLVLEQNRTSIIISLSSNPFHF
ncbi:long-chain-alcohol oxidase FAO3-like [Hibiscus syriacus]|uniref:long-chain-alcohol oxidase FAO3-like n=1 Tax=Hibiscus syriacus TaxID=106335 RepID=UPI0019205505|nr:long-chain-alcohol oxidase FAO3-like [Hibiscus syriacus]